MINNKKILAVVIARAESKGIKNKNVKMLMGQPLFMWSILVAVKSRYIDKIVVSSNCELVKKYFNNYLKDNNNFTNFFNCNEICEKFLFIKRPENISGDLSKNEEALIHVCKYLKRKHKEEYDVIITLQPTSPVRIENLIDVALEEYVKDNYDSLLTGRKMTPFFWQKMAGDNSWQYIVDKNNCCRRKMRQEFREWEFVYWDTGNLYFTNKDILLRKKCRIGNKLLVYEIEGINTLQIDTEFDFKLIENVIKSYNLSSLI